MTYARITLGLAICGVVATFTNPAAARGDGPDELKALARDPNSPEVQQEIAFNKARVAREKEMKKIRYHYFRATNNPQMRQEGLLQLRKFTEPMCYKSLIDVFQDQGEDVQRYILDVFAEAQTSTGDASLTWCALYGKKDEFRNRAQDRLIRRCKESGSISDTVKLVTFETLRSKNETAIAGAADLALKLGMFEAIPHLIPAQVGRAANTGEDRTGDLAWILVGQQVAFVSDLTPVVSQSAVAFDPQLAVATEGSLLRIQDAAVTSVYRGSVNSALQGLGSALTGQDLSPLGYNIPAWREWYKTSYLPAKAALDAKKEKEAAHPQQSAPVSGGG